MEQHNDTDYSDPYHYLRSTDATSSNATDQLYYNHFPHIANYSYYGNDTHESSMVANLSLINFVSDENPYGLRYGMVTSVVLR